MTTERLFHLTDDTGVARLREAGLLEPSSLAGEGFVHLSFAHQLAGTLEVHFAGVDELCLLELVPEAVADALRLEASRGGADFPHLYRAVTADDVRQLWRLRRAPGGAFAVPAFAAAGDDPPGTPL